MEEQILILLTKRFTLRGEMKIAICLPLKETYPTMEPIF